MSEIIEPSLDSHSINAIAPLTHNKEQGEQYAQNNEIIVRSIQAIESTQAAVANRLGLAPLSPDAVAETDMALIHIAEATLADMRPVSSEQLTEEAFESVVIEGALEATGKRSSGKNPIVMLEVYGYGGEITDVIANLHETHATLPNHLEAAPIVVAEIEKLNHESVMQDGTSGIEYVTANPEVQVQHKSPESTVELKELSDTVVVNDALDRLQLPNAQRSGSEINDRETGESLKPCFELEIDDQDKASVLEVIKNRREAVDKANSILDRYESGTEVATDGQPLKELDVSLLMKLTTVGYESEGKIRQGTLADVFMSPEDTDALIRIGARLDALPQNQGFEKRSVTYGLTETAIAQRVVDYAEQLIPEGTPLIHTMKGETIHDIVADGSLKSRFMLEGSSTQDSVTNNGPQTQLVHFAEPGKINAYGDAAIAIPIEQIIAKSPYHQAERSYKGQKGAGFETSQTIDTQEKMGKITFSVPEAPLALQRRIAVLRSRFEDGLIAERTQGESNNVSFAATQEAASAAAYEYSIEDALVFVGNDERYRNDNFLDQHSTRDTAWRDRHLVPLQLDRESLGSGGVSRIRLPLPAALREGATSIAAYGPITQIMVGFSEAGMVDKTQPQRSHVSIYQEYTGQNERRNREKLAAESLQQEQQRADSKGMSLKEYREAESAELRRKIDADEFVF